MKFPVLRLPGDFYFVPLWLCYLSDTIGDRDIRWTPAPGRQQCGWGRGRGGTARHRRKCLASLRASACRDGEVMAHRVAPGAGARPLRLAVVITFPGRGCFEGRVVKRGEEKAAGVVRLLLLFWFFVFILYYSASDYWITCCVLHNMP